MPYEKILFYGLLLFGLLGVFSAFSYIRNKPQKIQIPPIVEVQNLEDISQPYLSNHRTKGLSIDTYQDGKIAFHNFGINSTENTKGQLIQGHDGSGHPTSQWDLPTFAGVGAIRSTTADMMKYLVANISKVSAYHLTHQYIL